MRSHVHFRALKIDISFCSEWLFSGGGGHLLERVTTHFSTFVSGLSLVFKFLSILDHNLFIFIFQDH